MPPAESSDHHRTLRAVAVPIMLFVSSMLMATAWLGHLKFRDAPYLVALLACWLIVLPEYVLNVAAVRVGKGIYSGATMASFHLCWGVVCVVLVSRYYLRESMNARQLGGFVVMLAAMLLIGSKEHSDHLPDPDPDPEPEVAS